MPRTHDLWERLVAAVLRKIELWELFHDHSRSPSVLSDASELLGSSFHSSPAPQQNRVSTVNSSNPLVEEGDINQQVRTISAYSPVDDAELHSRVTEQEKEIAYLKQQIALARIKELQMLNEKYTLERTFFDSRMELHLRATEQEKEIMYLRQQISLANTKEVQMLNEKYTLERMFSELLMPADEKQSGAITSAANNLVLRKDDLQMKLYLRNELKAVEDQIHVFTSGMLQILAECGALPHVTNAALSNSIKQLHDGLQLKIRTSQARLAELHSMIGSYSNLRPMGGKLPSSPMVFQGSYNSHYVDGKIFEPTDDTPRYVQDSDPKVKSLARNFGMLHLLNNESLLLTRSDIHSKLAGHIVDNVLYRNGYQPGSERRTGNQFSHSLTMHSGVGSFGSEDEGPGIVNFQILGIAKPGFRLLGAGCPVRGTLFCIFQWVRHYPDGTRQYIDGATNPDYIVTGDDVDKLIALECIPVDRKGQEGDPVSIFANNHNKITCDEEMQKEIDSHISGGLAIFNVLVLVNSSDIWEQATLSLGRSSFQVKVEKKHDVVISEKYSEELLITIPGGVNSLFVLTCSNGSSYPFSTNDDIWLRDTLVLTVRIFRSKALDGERKGKAVAQ